MKLNLNFDLYKGTTRLKQWYKEVKAHFTQVQEAHNALEDTVAAESGKLSTEITQRTNADIALSDRINAAENARSNADASLGQRITTEAKNREKADNNLQVRIDEISQSSGTSTLFGDELMTHTVKFVAPENKPTLYWDGDQEYYGDSICVDIELTNSFYIDGKQISGAFEELCISIPCDEGVYIVVQYNFVDNTCDIHSSKNAVASTISGNVWTFTLYHYYDIRLDFKVDSSSPTGSRYVFEGCNTDYIEPNEDTTGNTYTIANTYERLRTLDNLNTENKNSFLDAVNENTDKINSTALELQVHITQTPDTDGGVHGVRAADGKIEIFDGRNWVKMKKDYKTYGVSIDLTNSDPEAAVTYTDDAVGIVAGSSDWDNTNIFRDIRPCLFKDGAVVGYLDPDDFSKFADGTDADITSGDAGDVMIEIPKVGVKIATGGDTLTVQVTDDPNAEGFSYLAHTRENEGDRDKVYIGAFLASNVSSKLRSLSGKTPIETSLTEMRTLAQANGSGYEQIAFYQLTLLQCLFLIKYKNRDSQTALGKGLVDAGGCLPTGGTLTKGMDYGETTGTQQMKFLGIEDFWGNYWQWLDGLVSSSDYHALTATTNFNDDGTGYKDLGELFNSNTRGYIKTPQGTNELGFIVKQVGGSVTTYFADYAVFYGGYVASFGGGYDAGSYAGAFYLDVYGIPEDEIGGRLMYL